MAQQVKTLAAKADNLGSVLRTYMYREEADFSYLISDLRSRTVASTNTHTCTHNTCNLTIEKQ